MPGKPARSGSRFFLAGFALSLTVGPGCSEQAAPKPRGAVQASDFRKIRFAGEWVVVPFRSGLTKAKVADAGLPPKSGERVTLSDAGDGDVFLAADLASLQFYHSSPGREQLGRFRTLAETGKLFVVAKGTTAVVAKVIEGQLPDGLKALELRLLGENGGVAWVSEAFARGLPDDKTP